MAKKTKEEKKKEKTIKETKELEEKVKEMKAEEQRSINRLLFPVIHHFIDYNKGYKIISLSGNYGEISLSGDILSKITNFLTEKYDCKLVSLSHNQSTFTDKEYTFVFFKE